MKTSRLLFSLFVGILSLSVESIAANERERVRPEGAPEIKAVMYSFLSSLQGLKPYMVSADDFAKPENKKDILQKLGDFSKLVESSKPIEVSQSPGFNVTYDLLGKHISEIEHLYSAGAIDSAWQRLNATGTFCLGCHSRLPEKVKTSAFNWAKKGSGNELWRGSYKDAEFFFLSHQYLPSLEIMNDLIQSHQDPNNKADLESIFERKINFYARIQRDPKAAIKSLNADLKNKKLPTSIQSDIRVWIQGFEALKNQMRQLSKRSSDAEVLSVAKGMVQEETSDKKLALGDPQTIPLLWISGLLYERVFKGGQQKEMPEMMYLLAKAERNLQSIRVYSLADVYLKQCVELFPKHDVAQKCFNDYSVSMKQRYRMAPETVENSIRALSEVLKAGRAK